MANTLFSLLEGLPPTGSATPSGPAGGGLTGTYPNPDIASGIDAAKIANGSVSNAEFQYLDGVTSAIQTQINAKLTGNSNQLPPAPTGAGKLIYDNGTAYVENTAGTTSQVLIGGAVPTFGNVPSAALTSIPGANVTGTVPFAALPIGQNSTSVPAGNDNRFAPIPSAGQGKVVYDNGGTYAVTAIGTTSQVLIGGATPAFGNVPSAAITSVPFSALPVGNTSTTVTVGNDARLNPAPTSNGYIPVDSGTNYISIAPAAAGKVLQSNGGGNFPSYEYGPGSVAVLSTFSRVGTLTSGLYIGPLSHQEGSFNGGTATTFPIPWIAPCGGVLKNFKAQSVNNSSGSTFYFYRSAAGTQAFFSTSPGVTISSGNRSGSDNTNTIFVSAGDQLVTLILGASYSTPGLMITAQFEPYSF